MKLTTRLISQSTTAAINAEPISETENPATILSTKRIKMALSTKVNKPNVRILMGSVRITKIGLMIALKMPRIKATIRAVVKLSILKPGTRLAVTKIAIADRIQLTRVLIRDSITWSFKMLE